MEWKAGAPLLSINDLVSLFSIWKGTLGSLHFIGPEFGEQEAFVYVKNNIVMLFSLFLFIHKDKYIWMTEAGVVKVI